MLEELILNFCYNLISTLILLSNKSKFCYTRTSINNDNGDSDNNKDNSGNSNNDGDGSNKNNIIIKICT